MDVHIPYMPPNKYVRRFHGRRVNRREMVRLYFKMIDNPADVTETERATLHHLYDADISYVDDAVGWLLEGMKDLLGNTLIIFTADHGDEFGEHGRFSHTSVYEGTIRIPLIIAGPGMKAGCVVRGQVSLEDLPPTVIELIGLDKVATFHGESLMPLINGERKVDKGIISATIPPMVPKHLIIAYRRAEWKYILTENLETPGVTLTEELYDLRNDPGETKNLHGTKAQAAKRFELEARDKISQFRKSKTTEATAYEKERIRARLKKLAK
jgi:arylsulfatase A-like enzyme